MRENHAGKHQLIGSAGFTLVYSQNYIIFRLYNSINLTYPPVLAGMAAESAQDDSCIAALNQSLKRTVLPDEVGLVKVGLSEKGLSREGW